MKFKDEVCNKYGIRMHKKQKSAFRGFVQEKANEMGYKMTVEKSMIAKNIVIGDPDKAEIVFTAHYDTPPRLPKFYLKNMLFHSIVTLPLSVFGLMGLSSLFMYLQLYKLTIAYMTTLSYALPISAATMIAYCTGFLGGANKTNFNDNSSGCLSLLNLMDRYKDLPQNLKDKVAFVFTDNEEKMLLGSISYRNRHKNYKQQTFVNLDCVGRGKNVNLYYFGKEPKIVNELQSIIDNHEGYVSTKKKSTMMSLSDHYPVRKADHVCLLNTDTEDKKSLFKQIHSSNDYILEDENIDNIVKIISKTQKLKPLEEELQKINDNVQSLTTCKQKYKNKLKQLGNIELHQPLKAQELEKNINL